MGESGGQGILAERWQRFVQGLNCPKCHFEKKDKISNILRFQTHILIVDDYSAIICPLISDRNRIVDRLIAGMAQRYKGRRRCDL